MIKHLFQRFKKPKPKNIKPLLILIGEFQQLKHTYNCNSPHPNKNVLQQADQTLVQLCGKLRVHVEAEGLTFGHRDEYSQQTRTKIVLSGNEYDILLLRLCTLKDGLLDRCKPETRDCILASRHLSKAA